jgi:hypothetical protein
MVNKAEQQLRFDAWRRTWTSDRVTGLAAWSAALHCNGWQIDRDESRIAFGRFFQRVSNPEVDWELFDAWCTALWYAEIAEKAEAVFGSREAVLAWLHQPALILNHQLPIQVLLESPHTVMNLLREIEHDAG